MRIFLLILNTAIEPGVYGLLGQNGAGKSTLIHLLAGILVPDEGSVLWNDKPIARLGESYLRILGYMPQSSNVDIDITVTGFLHYMAALKKIKKPDSTIESLITYLHLEEYRHFRLNQLSGGTKQRVMIAQSLLNDPKILLLDEPTAGLDPVERVNLRNIIAECGKDKIVLLATHVISDVEFIAENIIMMKAGKLLAMLSQKDLMAHTFVYETIQDKESLLIDDPDARIVNQHYRDGKMYIRYLSKKGTSESKQVETTLDDVYLDWLG